MNDFFDWLGLIAGVALVMVLVRPGSQGPALVTSVGNGFSSIIGKATGGGTF